MKINNLYFTIFTIFIFSTANFIVAQNQQNDQEYLKAMDFIRVNRLIDALPLLEKVASRYPNDAEVLAHFGVAILTNSVTIKDENLRKKELDRAGNILRKAQKLGTKNVVALHYLDLIERGGTLDSVDPSANKEVEDLIREGEGYFGQGQYDKALAAYERAFKLDPQNYNAALFAGDCFYSQEKFKESEIWFAKAVAIDPNREQAFRFWGDALANQGNGKEAMVKFANAFIAEPSSRLAWETLLKAINSFGNRKSSPFVVLPSEEQISNPNLIVDLKQLSTQDGTDNWKFFAETRKKQLEKFSKNANGKAFEPTVAEDVEALKSVVAGLKLSLQKGIKLSPSMENLVLMEKAGTLDIYTILIMHGGDSCPEYEDFREKNRSRMERFLVEYFAEIKDGKTNE